LEKIQSNFVFSKKKNFIYFPNVTVLNHFMWWWPSCISNRRYTKQVPMIWCSASWSSTWTSNA